MINNPLLNQTRARRAQYRSEVKLRIYLGVFIATALTNLVYQLFN